MNEAFVASHELRGQLQTNASLAEYTSWRCGGAADYLYLPHDLNDLAMFLKKLPQDMPLTWLGLGSNTLVRDKGVPGVVIVTQGKLNKLQQMNAEEIRAEVGVSAAQLARYAARLGTEELGFLAGIPGTVGGALAMNAGCFGGETWQHVIRVETINRQGDITERSADAYQVGYRSVIRPVEEWFIAGYFKLKPGDKNKALANIKDLLAKRNQSQPTGTANCGSVFRNPPGDYAGRLIEMLKLKGKKIGGACVSMKHANFIINEDNATAADIEQLIAEVKAIVAEKAGVQLITEVCIIGRKQ